MVMGLLAACIALCAAMAPADATGRGKATAPARDSTPSVYIAGGLTLDEHWSLANSLLKKWPGYLGFDDAVLLDGPATLQVPTAERVAKAKAAGIKVICEGHMTVPTPVAKELFLTNPAGQTSQLVPYHGHDVTQPEILAILKARIEKAARTGFCEFLLIDYVWPWDGRYGYGERTVNAFRTYLAGADEGIVLETEKGRYATYKFWDYLKLYTDVSISPGDVGLTDWSQYVPCAEDGSSKNYFLFNALYHYASAAFLQKAGEHAQQQRTGFLPSLNPGESIYNATDMYVYARCKGVSKLAYEFFGMPGAPYHVMRYYASLLRDLGKQHVLLGEIHAGGHGPSRYSWEVAYAHYYDCTAESNPVDYNNQYLEPDWSKTPKSDTEQYPRYAHWAAGALGFMQSHCENSDLQPPKRTVVVTTRSILDAYGGIFAMADPRGANLSGVLDAIHIPFDAAGTEEFASYAKDASVLVYCPPRSCEMHLAAVERWLAASPSRVLVTHSYVPFRRANATLFTADPATDGLSLHLGSVAERTVSLPGIAPSTRQVYTVAGKTVLASSEGVPLITEARSDTGNRILYINVDIRHATDALNQEIARRVMALAGVIPEATVSTPARKGIHIYSVPGGSSAVVWDTAALEAQSKSDYYSRETTPPAEVSFRVKPNTAYLVYDFYADAASTVTSTKDGNLRCPTGHSVDIFYYGKRGDPAFAATLASVKKTRRVLATLDPANPSPPMPEPYPNVVKPVSLRRD